MRSIEQVKELKQEVNDLSNYPVALRIFGYLSKLKDPVSTANIREYLGTSKKAHDDAVNYLLKFGWIMTVQYPKTIKYQLTSKDFQCK